MLLSDPKYWPQRRDGECLVACCKMVLAYLGIEKSEDWLWRHLATDEVTPFPKIEALAPLLGVIIELHKDGVPENFAPYLESGLPVIAAIDADDVRYWPYTHNHAVVVVGFNEQIVFVYDPAQPETPLAVDIGAFMLVWSRRDFQYAVIRLAAES